MRFPGRVPLVREGRCGGDWSESGQSRVTPEVQDQIRPAVSTPVRRGTQSRQFLWGLEGEIHVWAQIHGDRAYDRDHRPQRPGRACFSQAQGARPRSGSGKGGARAELKQKTKKTTGRG